MAGPGQEGGLPRGAFQAGQARRGPVVGAGGVDVPAKAFVGAGQGELGLGCLAFLALLAQPLEHGERVGGPAKLDKGLGAPEQQRRVVGMHALHGFAVEPLGFLEMAELEGGGRQAHLVVDRGSEIVSALGLAILALGVQGLPCGAAELARGGPAEQLRQHDGEKIHQGAHRRDHHQDDPDPEQLPARAHHVHAHADDESPDDQEARQAKGHQQAHAEPSLASLRGSAFSAGASRSTSAW